MELNKGKYTRKEVIDILNAYKNEYEKRIADQRVVISNLNQEITELNAVSEGLKEKEQILVSALVRAEKTAIGLEKKSQEQYALEIERLKKFTSHWNAYFNQLKEKYPLYQPTKDALEIKEEIDGAKISDAKDFIDKLDEKISQVNPEKFDPKAKIKDYIAATSDNGFNLDEVLHPGELKLEDICKELGLIDSDD